MVVKKFIWVLFFISTCTWAQKKPKLKGSRVVIEVSDNLSPFNALELNADLEIKLQRASMEGVDLVIDDNLVDILKFEVRDSTLVIDSYYKIASKKKMEITINYIALESILLRDGKVFSDGFLSTDVLYINTFGGSKLQLNAKATEIQFNMEENSSSNLNLDADFLNIIGKGRANSKIFANADTTTIELTGSADCTLEGNTDSMEIKAMDNADVKGAEYSTSKIYLEVDGSANTKINARESFELVSRGNAKTHLYGNPTITITEFQNKSQLLKEEF